MYGNWKHSNLISIIIVYLVYGVLINNIMHAYVSNKN